MKKTRKEIEKDVFRYMFNVPTDREIRLLKDIVRQANPLFSKNNIFIAKQVKELLGPWSCPIDLEIIINVKSFKKLLFNKVIDKVEKAPNGKFKIKTKKIRIK